MSKPSDEWDDALIEECEETMLYCAERKKVLYSEEQQSRVGFFSAFRVRKSLIVAAVALTALMLSATIAQAAGFRVWSAVIHWDINYLRVDYTTNSTDVPNDETVNHSDSPVEEPDAVVETFNSFESYRGFMGEEILYLDGAYEQMFCNATVTKDFGMTIARAEYSVSNSTIIVKVFLSANGNEDESLTASFIQNEDYSEVFETMVAGVSCIFGAGTDNSICTFKYGRGLYRITGNVDIRQIESIVNNLLKGD